MYRVVIVFVLVITVISVIFVGSCGAQLTWQPI